MKSFLAGLAVILVAVLIGITVLHGDPETTHPPHATRRDGALAPLPLAAVGGDSAQQVFAWIEGVERGEWFAGVAAETARMEAARAAASAGVATPRGGAAGQGVGDCTGFAIPDSIIWRESRGDPWAVNASSGAFGCAQVMPLHWAPSGACGDLDKWTLDGQRECVDRLSQGGTRLSPWAG